MKVIVSHLVSLRQSTLANAGHLQDFAAAAGRGLGEAAGVGVALVARVASAEGSMPATVDDAGGVVAALVDAARIQGTHLESTAFVVTWSIFCSFGMGLSFHTSSHGRVCRWAHLLDKN